MYDKFAKNVFLDFVNPVLCLLDVNFGTSDLTQQIDDSCGAQSSIHYVSTTNLASVSKIGPHPEKLPSLLKVCICTY